MSRKAGIITINLNAGTAALLTDLERGGAAIRKFGREGASGAAESRAALKALEGQVFNNTRAADKFLETVLGGGPLLRAAFPILGAAAFGGVIVETTKKMYEFYRSIQDAPEKIEGSFRSLNASLRLTNDELDESNVRLENEIAKLEGRHENTLKVALAEAKSEADRLADSLDRDLERLNKLLDENKASLWQQAFGRISDKGLREMLGGATGSGGFRGRVADINEEGQRQIASAKTPKEADAARAALDAKLQQAYSAQIAELDREISLNKLAQEASGKFTLSNYGPILEEQTAARRALAQEQRHIGEAGTATSLKEKKAAADAAATTQAQDRPFEDRMRAMNAQLEAAKAKLAAIGAPEGVQIAAKAFEEAQKAILETDKALEKHHKTLTLDEDVQIVVKAQRTAAVEAETQWKTKLDASTTSTQEHVESLALLTAAIGKGYEATKQANIETRLMQELGAHRNDADWMVTYAEDVAKLRADFGAEFEAQHGQQSAERLDKLRDEIELEKALAAAQKEGAEAVRQAALAAKLRQMTQAGASKDEIAAEMDLYNAQRENAAAGGLDAINQKIAATERLTAAIRGGAEAVRQAGLENKYAGMTHEGKSPEEVAAERRADAAARQRELTEEAIRTGQAYADQVEKMDLEIAALQRLKEEQGDSLAIELSLRDLENQRLHALVEESLQLRGARDGVRAFFIEMQEDAKSAASIVYDALNSSLDRVSQNLAKLMTGQKGDWGAAFRGIGEQMTQDSVKSLAQKGLGKLGELFGVDIGKGKPDGTKANPFWVQLAAQNAGLFGPSGAGGSGPTASAPGGLFGEGSKGWMIFSALAKMGGFRAGGGPVDPGSAYVVGEYGPEMFVPSTPGTIAPGGKFGGTTVVHYHVDARGADLGAASRIQRGLEMTHDSAVATSVAASHEAGMRRPK